MARDRAVEVFSQLRVWDTEANNGVLIYLLLADHDVEILADRGVHAKVGPEGWESVCRRMEAEFRTDASNPGCSRASPRWAATWSGISPGEAARMSTSSPTSP